MLINSRLQFRIRPTCIQIRVSVSKIRGIWKTIKKKKKKKKNLNWREIASKLYDLEMKVILLNFTTYDITNTERKWMNQQSASLPQINTIIWEAMNSNCVIDSEAEEKPNFWVLNSELENPFRIRRVSCLVLKLELGLVWAFYLKYNISFF